MYYENGIPSIFETALEDGNGEAVREWLEEQRTEDTIEEVTEEMLQHLASCTYPTSPHIRHLPTKIRMFSIRKLLTQF